MSDELKPGTPLPWYKCGGYTTGYISIATKATKPRKLIVAGFSDDFTDEEQQANARYIVEACNNYQAQATRIAELEKALEFYADESRWVVAEGAGGPPSIVVFDFLYEGTDDGVMPFSVAAAALTTEEPK